MNSEEYKEHEFWIIDCPICGRKTLDSFYICSGCGWEYDLFIDYDNDASFSACNRTTLGEYKNGILTMDFAYDVANNARKGYYSRHGMDDYTFKTLHEPGFDDWYIDYLLNVYYLAHKALAVEEPKYCIFSLRITLPFQRNIWRQRQPSKNIMLYDVA